MATYPAHAAISIHDPVELIQNESQQGSSATDLCFGIIGASPAIRAVVEQIDMVASTDATVLLQGETGTGKGLIAQAIHNLSRRRRNSFIATNCSAIPADLFESEVFGHERGAFTDAFARRAGKLELAMGGTLFLDEIGDLPLAIQPKLLRVLQEREFERLGSQSPVRADVRIIAATNQDLATMVMEHRFRADLHYRLNVFPITVPPLRERIDDIPLLAGHFSQLFASRLGKRPLEIPDDAIDRLMRHDWPGNIRELQNVIERAVTMSNGSTIEIPALQHGPHTAPAVCREHRTLAEIERRQILQALSLTKGLLGGKRGAACRLGVPRTTLINKMHRLGISAQTGTQSYGGHSSNLASFEFNAANAAA
jgi:formate hydrogenlyase transcriptional activator